MLTHALKRRSAVCLDLAAPGLLPLVRAQVVQLIINLVGNAIEAFGDRPRSANAIHITTGDDASTATMVIEDSGPGIPAGERDRIFQPFHTTKPAGTGLGLAIAARIAAQHGGGITCDTSPSFGGARFIVTLRAWTPEGA